jgi:hypothetical protein
MTRHRMGRVATARTAAAVAGAVPLAAGTLCLLLAPAAAASTVVGTATIAHPGATAAAPVATGGSTTPFTVALPPNASCTGDTAHHGYHVYSYLVPRGTDLASVTFETGPSTGYGLVQSDGRYYGAINTASNTGQIIGVPNDFTWGPLARTGGGSVPLSTLLDGRSRGVWEAGIACANSHGALDRYWNTQVDFAATTHRDGGFSWTARPGAASVATGATARGAAASGPTAAVPFTAQGGAAGEATVGVAGERGAGAPGAAAGTIGGGTDGSPAVAGLPVTAAVSAAVLAAVAGLLVLLWRNLRAGAAPTTRGSGR